MSFPCLRSFIAELRKNKDLIEIDAAVDPNLELAEIHRRVVEEEGPALLFTNVKGSRFRLVSNLFGTSKRTDLAFGDHGEKLVQEVARFPEELIPPTIGKIWSKRSTLFQFTKLGTKTTSSGEVLECVMKPADLDALPVITSWSEDGGPFVTLPLVYSEHPDKGIPNLGMYRLQRFSKDTTGLHMQIGKGGGFHLYRARERGEALPVNVFLGGPPALVLAAIAPLPEDVPELLLASLLLQKKVRMCENPHGPLPLLADAEFTLIGSSDPNVLRPEGPFGDHYGYYSLTHDFPVFNCTAVAHRKDAIYPATVVGKPRQEDYFIGEKLQKLLSPLFPLVMPSVKDLWSYGETGFHSLAAAVVKERYKREAMVSAFRILGEGQLSLTKFLLAVDKEMDLGDFPGVLKYILERADFRTDLYVFSNLSMDTLDYAGPKLNEGSKGVLLGIGDPIRTLPGEFSGEAPSYVKNIRVFIPGCLVIEGKSFVEDESLAQRVAQEPCFREWPLLVVSDDANDTTSSPAQFLWSTFTRFEPAADIYGSESFSHRFHVGLEPPVVIDARMKPRYPDELFCDEKTEKLVDSRWREYFPNGF